MFNYYFLKISAGTQLLSHDPHHNLVFLCFRVASQHMKRRMEGWEDINRELLKSAEADICDLHFALTSINPGYLDELPEDDLNSYAIKDIIFLLVGEMEIDGPEQQKDESESISSAQEDEWAMTPTAQEDERARTQSELIAERFIPLTPDEDVTVTDALLLDNEEVLIERFNAPITRRLMIALRPSIWLNDEVNDDIASFLIL